MIPQEGITLYVSDVQMPVNIAVESSHCDNTLSSSISRGNGVYRISRRMCSRDVPHHLLRLLGLALLYTTFSASHLVQAYTATIPRTPQQWTKQSSKLFGAYEDYMDALQKQQQQQKSFMSLNAASAYETGRLKVHSPSPEDGSCGIAPSNVSPQIDIPLNDKDVIANPSSSRRYYFDYSNSAKFNFEQQDPSVAPLDSFSTNDTPMVDSNYDSAVKFNFEQVDPPNMDSSVAPVAQVSEYNEGNSQKDMESFDDVVKFNFEQQELPSVPPPRVTDSVPSVTSNLFEDYYSGSTTTGSVNSEEGRPVFPSYEYTSASTNSVAETGTFTNTFGSTDIKADLATPKPSNVHISEWTNPDAEIASLVNTPVTTNVNPELAAPEPPNVYTSASTNPVTETAAFANPSGATDFKVIPDLATPEPSNGPNSMSTNLDTVAPSDISTTRSRSFVDDITVKSDLTTPDDGRPVFPSYVYTNTRNEPVSAVTTSTETSTTSDSKRDSAVSENSFVSSSASPNPDTATASSNIVEEINADLTTSNDAGRPAFPTYEYASAQTEPLTTDPSSSVSSTTVMNPDLVTSESAIMTSTEQQESIEELPLHNSEVATLENEIGRSSIDDSFSWSTAVKPVGVAPVTEETPSENSFDLISTSNKRNYDISDSNRLKLLNEMMDVEEKGKSFMSNESFLEAITSTKPLVTDKDLESSFGNGNVGSPKFAPGLSAISTLWKKSPLLRSLALSLQNDKNSENDKVTQVTMELPPDRPTLDTRGMTERIMKRVDAATNAQRGSASASGSGAGGSTSYEAFLRVEDNWTKLKQSSSKPNRKSSPFNIQSSFVTSDAGLGNPRCWSKLREQARSVSSSTDSMLSSKAALDYDVVVCGGTLGIFFALALLLRNPQYRICVVESAPVIRGRDQEWNISYNELYELVKLGVLTQGDVDDVITTEFPACRSGFKVRFLIFE